MKTRIYPCFRFLIRMRNYYFNHILKNIKCEKKGIEPTGFRYKQQA